MIHLNDEQVYSLAIKVATHAAFTEEDIANMRHVGECDDCYNLLCSVMAMQDVATHLADFALSPATQAAQASIKDKITAVIHLAINAVKPVLDQLSAGTTAWSFDAPLALAGSRSSKAGNSVIEKLEDIDNEKTYIAYDPDKKLLVIQIDCHESTSLPVVQIRTSDGAVQDVCLVPRGSVFWAEVHDLADGEYEIILQK